MFARGKADIQDGVNLTSKELEDYAGQLLGKEQNSPKFEVKETVADLPFDAPPDTPGAYFNGTVYLVTATIGDAAHARQVIAHEVIGHYGLRGFFAGVIHDPRITQLTGVCPDFLAADRPAAPAAFSIPHDDPTPGESESSRPPPMAPLRGGAAGSQP